MNTLIPHCANARTFVLVLILSTTAVGCSTDQKRAAKFMEEGHFDEASQLYERVVAKDPGNVEAATGLRQARQSLIDKRLIDVRLARTAGNHNEALEILLDTVNKENAWKFFPVGKVAFTQEEESDYAMRFAEQRVGADLKSRFPLRADYLLRRYQAIFESKQARRFEGARAATLKLGQETCRVFAKEKVRGKPYFTNFVGRYCRHWGEKGRPQNRGSAGIDIDSVAPIPKDTYFRDVNVVLDAEGLSETDSKAIESEFESALQKTAWYDSEGKLTLDTKVSGTYRLRHSRDEMYLTHPYSVSEPYTERVLVQKTRSVPYTETHYVFNPVTKQNEAQATTAYRNEQYSEYENQTRYRDVPREHRYMAWKHEQTISLNLEAPVILGRQGEGKFNAGVTENSRAEGVEHHENMPSIGLYPKLISLPDPGAWLKEQLTRFARDFEQKAVLAWRNLNCKLEASVDSFSATGDIVQKCLRQTMTDPPQLAETWHQTYLGVSTREATELLKD